MQTKKCNVVGDGCVGKSYLIAAYKTNTFGSEYRGIACRKQVPRHWLPVEAVFEIHELTLMNGGEEYTLTVTDTAGQEDYDRLRPLQYPETDVFLVCFSVVSPSSISNIQTKWLPEIKEHCPNTPYLLLGTKIDLRDDPNTIEELRKKNRKAISKKEGEALAERLKAVKYIECSAKTQEGVKNVFEEVLLVALKPPKPPRKRPIKKCHLL